MNKKAKEFVARIRESVEENCKSCKFQDGRACNWWDRKDKDEMPPCQPESFRKYYIAP